jgi:exopolyphosphatase/guanosine-5'-triphosphate,3'-diphosphate pyrophosphatase
LTQFWGVDADPTAQGRIKGARPVAVLDIGSNSVRLVVYERHARALTPLYNEKSACALGRGIAQSKRLADANMDKALEAMKRFALVARMMRVGKVYILATSAVRDAANRDSFVSAVEAIMEAPVRVLSGQEEAHYAALGVVAGIPGFAGVVGDLGGGSLELSDIANGHDTNGWVSFACRMMPTDRRRRRRPWCRPDLRDQFSRRPKMARSSPQLAVRGVRWPSCTKPCAITRCIWCRTMWFLPMR